MIGTNGGLIGKARDATRSLSVPGVWTSDEQLKARRAYLWAANADADQNYFDVALLLHGNGTNGSTTILDSSSTPKTPTITGNTQISTTESKFDGASIAFDGSGDRLTYAASNDWNFSGSPHTVEAWVRTTTLPPSGNGCRLIQAGANNTTGALTFFYFDSNGIITCGVPRTTGFTSITTTASIQVNTWHHLAAVVNGASSWVFIDGVGTSGTITSPTSTGANSLFIGYDTALNVNFQFNGYIDELRITKGVARYTANFTPPTAPFPTFDG